MNNKQMEMMAREHDMTAVDAEFAEEVANAAVKGAVGTYQTIESAVVGGYKKIEDAFVSTFMAKEGESVEEAKARVAADTEARQAKINDDMEAREAAQKAMIEKNLEASRNAGKRN